MRILFLVFYFIFYLLSSTTFAASSQTQMDVSASVEPSCTIISNNLSFGIYNSSISSTSTILKVLCTKGTKFSIELESSNGTGGTSSWRMNNGQNFLDYALYQDSGAGRIWGNNNNALIATGTGRIQIFKVYGRIPANQRLPSGYYFDNVNIKLNIGKTSPSLAYQLSLSMLVEATIKNNINNP